MLVVHICQHLVNLEPSAPGSVGLEFGRRRRKRLPENFLTDFEEPGNLCKIPSDGPAIHKVPSCHVSSIFCTHNAGASVKSVILLSLLLAICSAILLQGVMCCAFP